MGDVGEGVRLGEGLKRKTAGGITQTRSTGRIERERSRVTDATVGKKKSGFDTMGGGIVRREKNRNGFSS